MFDATLPDVGAARDRLLVLGPEAAADEDLLLVVAGRRAAAAGLRRLAGRFGGLLRLSRRPPRELAGEPGVGLDDALRLHAALELGRRALVDVAAEGPLDCGAAVHARFRGLARAERETFWVLALDARTRLMRAIRVCEGGLGRCAFRPADLLTPALREGAHSVIVVHNHPSGDPEPSSADVAVTRRIVAAADIVGLRLLDHVVVAAGGYVSLRERGLITPLALPAGD
jgi:DNA repair protein RadC